MDIARHILLVEDDIIDQETIQRVLKKDLQLTNELVIKENGVEALIHLRDKSIKKPCVVILDLNMPKMGGIEFLEIARKDAELKLLPVVVLTTSAEEKDKVSTYGLGVQGYMVKPVDYPQFVDAMRALNAYWTINEIPKMP